MNYIFNQKYRISSLWIIYEIGQLILKAIKNKQKDNFKIYSSNKHNINYLIFKFVIFAALLFFRFDFLITYTPISTSPSPYSLKTFKTH